MPRISSWTTFLACDPTEAGVRYAEGNIKLGCFMARQTLASLQQEVIDWLVTEFREFKKAEQDYRIRQDLEKVCIVKIILYSFFF